MVIIRHFGLAFLILNAIMAEESVDKPNNNTTSTSSNINKSTSMLPNNHTSALIQNKTGYTEGGKIDIKVNNASIQIVTKAPLVNSSKQQTYGREGEQLENNTPEKVVILNDAMSIMNATISQTAQNSTGMNNRNKNITDKVIPVSEESIVGTLDGSIDDKTKSVPRKGVEFGSEKQLEDLAKTNSNNVNMTSSMVASTIVATVASTTSTTTTTVKPIPKKPLVTIGNNEEPFEPSHFVSKGRSNATLAQLKDGAAAVPSIELYEHEQASRSSSVDYIVPIVGVILSVPLVAIIINMVYKRTKEWWHHRHYSRMDFLIDGMYNH